MERRNFLKLMIAAGLGSGLRGRVALGAPGSSDAMWIHVQAMGGWDQALFCDPKPSVRPGLMGADKEVRQAGNIAYLGFADFGKPADQGFFGTFYDRLLVFNAVDTSTNNHEIGIKYSSTGSRNDGHPCLAAQIAAVYGQAQPLAFMDYGGYDQTGDAVPPTRVQQGQSSQLTLLGSPNLVGAGQGNFLPSGAQTLVEAAHRRRLTRLQADARLPGPVLGMARLQQVRDAQKGIAKLVIPNGPDTFNKLIDIAFSGYEQGLTTSMGLVVGGFDSHTANETTQATQLKSLLDLVTYIATQSELRQLPAVVVMTSDFGRSPHYTGTGTDHWPMSSVMVLMNAAARKKGLALPTNQVIGATTDGAVAQALRGVKVNAKTLQRDDAGITVTPGHVYRALRRVAKVDGADVLRRFPITVDQDLAIG